MPIRWLPVQKTMKQKWIGVCNIGNRFNVETCMLFLYFVCTSWVSTPTLCQASPVQKFLNLRAVQLIFILCSFPTQIGTSEETFELFIRSLSLNNQGRFYNVFLWHTIYCLSSIPPWWQQAYLGLKDWNKSIEKCWKSQSSQHTWENSWKIAWVIVIVVPIAL